MKKVLVALVIVMGLGFSVAKADEPEGKLYKVIILSSDFHEQAVFLNERGNILNR